MDARPPNTGCQTVSDSMNRLQSLLRTVTPATSGWLTDSDFLALGAVVGVLGWTGTAAIEWFAVPYAGFVALALWTPLVAVMVIAAIQHVPDTMRFSKPMIAWGVCNVTATVVTVVAVTFGVPSAVGVSVGGGGGGGSDTLPFGFATVALGPAGGVVWSLWAFDLAVGYVATALFLRDDRQPARAAGYSYAAFLGFGLLVYHGTGLEALRSVRYLTLAALHGLPLGLDSRTSLSGVARTAVLYIVVVGLVALGAVIW